MKEVRVTLRDGSEVVRTASRRITCALAYLNLTRDDEGNLRREHRVLSWHDSLAEARYYERLGGETYIVPVTEVTPQNL